MTPEEVCSILTAERPDAAESASAAGLHPHVLVRPQHWRSVAAFLRDDPRLRFDWLRCITAVDHIEDGLFTLIYELHATQAPAQAGGLWRVGGEIAVKVRIPRDAPRVDSVADIWPAANWHEREAFDLMGVHFTGHPDLRRILCCDDWVGHPLRRDYEFPLEYRGIPGTTEYAQSRPQH